MLPGTMGKFKPLNPMTKVIVPPYFQKMVTHLSNLMDIDTSASNMATGKIVMVYANFNGWTADTKLGMYTNLFSQQVTVPSNPAIVAAEIKIEYSYMYTGWDTYGGIRGLQTLLRTNGLAEQLQDNPMPVFDWQTGSSFPPYLVAGTICPRDTVETEFGEFVHSGSDSVIVQRYAIPGSQFTVEYGLVFPFDTKKGAYGCYHYAEMILKKITIHYLKADEN
jgi:hypothetical protein